jgi:hypothetical protein
MEASLAGCLSARPGRKYGNYFFVPLAISAADAFVLGGEIANPGGECAPEASSGLEMAGVNGET